MSHRPWTKEQSEKEKDQDSSPLFEGIVSFDSVMAAAHTRGLVRPLTYEDGTTGELFPIVCKPQREAFELALAQCGYTSSDRSRVLFIDDSPRNIAGARALGMKTVYVGTGTVESEWSVVRLEELPKVCPELFSLGLEGLPPVNESVPDETEVGRESPAGVDYSMAQV